MKLSIAALALATPSVLGFSSRTTKVSSTALSSTMEPPERIAPDAGYIPEWENRPGLSPEKFMESDMSKPDLAGMWECPLTRWDSDGYVSENRTRPLDRIGDFLKSMRNGSQFHLPSSCETRFGDSNFFIFLFFLFVSDPTGILNFATHIAESTLKQLKRRPLKCPTALLRFVHPTRTTPRAHNTLPKTRK